MATLTDQQGNISRYTYDEDRGTLQEAISPSNVVTSYTYDSNNNQLIGVSIEDQANTYSYVADKVATINIGGDIQYNYSYDLYGRLQAIAVGDTQLARYNYNSSGQCTMRDFGDNYSLRYEYDSLDRPVSQKYVLTIAAISKEIDYYKQDFFYGSNGQLSAQIDHTAKNHTKYVYDLSGRLVSERIYDTEELSNNALLQSIEYSFADKTNYLTAIRQKSSLGMQDIDFRYGNSSSGEMPDRVYDVTWNGQTLQSNIYDSFGRLTNRVIKPSTSVELNNQYSYLNGSTEGATTTLVGSLTNPMGTYVYTYDAAGNISSISDGTSRIDYQYDGLNQLIREDNQKAGYSYTYIYENGRIVSRNKYNYTRGSLGTLLGSQSWTYSETGAKPLASWKDYEVAAGGTGNTYTYSLAEPTNLGYAVGSDGSEVEYQWQGDRLWMISKTVPAANGDHNTVESSPFYDADGKRIRKNVVYRTVNADYTDFTENSTNISYFYSGDMLVGQSTDRTSLLFLYDDSNSYFGFKYNGTPYYYIKNLQDDVIGIADASGSIVVTYVYDAWGSLLDISGTLADTVGTVNPIRYRSYYYDGEVGLYYLNNRYYDPERCMFLGIDDPEVLSTTPTELTDRNLFAYCDNNPISRADDDGRFWHILVGACIGAVVDGTMQVVANVVQQKKRQMDLL